MYMWNLKRETNKQTELIDTENKLVVARGELEEAQAGIKIAGRNINNLR